MQKRIALGGIHAGGGGSLIPRPKQPGNKARGGGHIRLHWYTRLLFMILKLHALCVGDF